MVFCSCCVLCGGAEIYCSSMRHSKSIKIDHFKQCFSERENYSLTFHRLEQMSKIFPDILQNSRTFLRLFPDRGNPGTIVLSKKTMQTPGPVLECELLNPEHSRPNQLANMPVIHLSMYVKLLRILQFVYCYSVLKECKGVCSTTKIK